MTLHALLFTDLVDSTQLVERLVKDDLLRVERDRLLPTLAGLAVTDSLARDFEVG